MLAMFTHGVNLQANRALMYALGVAAAFIVLSFASALLRAVVLAQFLAFPVLGIVTSRIFLRKVLFVRLGLRFWFPRAPPPQQAVEV